MGTKATGLILMGPGQVQLGEKELPDPDIYEALIRVTTVSTCNTDTGIVDDFIMPEIKGRFIGHECVGVVEKVGERVEYFKPGDRICVPSLTPDWHSIEAQQGGATFSQGGMAFDWGFKRDGTFATHIVCRDVDMNCAKIPDNVTNLQALMVVDMMTTAWQGVEKTDIPFGSTVVIFGIGPVGLCATRAVDLKCAGRIICIGSNPLARKIAASYGATDFVDYHDGDVVEQVLELNGGPVDVSFLCGGKGETVDQAIRMTRPMGSVTSVNAFYDDATIHVPSWNSGMRTQYFSWWQNTGGRWMLDRYLKMIANGKFDPTPIWTHINHGVEEMELTLRQKAWKDCLKPACILSED